MKEFARSLLPAAILAGLWVKTLRRCGVDPPPSMNLSRALNLFA
jgi:hypothetical protein